MTCVYFVQQNHTQKDQIADVTLLIPTEQLSRILVHYQQWSWCHCQALSTIWVLFLLSAADWVVFLVSAHWVHLNLQCHNIAQQCHEWLVFVDLGGRKEKRRRTSAKKYYRKRSQLTEWHSNTPFWKNIKEICHLYIPSTLLISHIGSGLPLSKRLNRCCVCSKSEKSETWKFHISVLGRKFLCCLNLGCKSNLKKKGCLSCAENTACHERGECTNLSHPRFPRTL